MSQLLQNHISPLDPEALSALEARGFDAEEFLQLGLSVGLEAGSRRLAVPYREQGQVVAIRTGSLEGGFSGLQGGKWLGMSEPPLYNVDCLRDATLANEPLLVVESEMACWAAMVSGFRRVVGVAAVLAMDGRRQPQLETAAELMRDASEVVIATFDDEHGQKLRANIAETIGAVRCKWVSYPKGCSDLLSTLRTFKARGVQETIKRAQWFAMPGFYSMSELPEPPLNPAYGTGIVGLDEHMRLRRGDVTIVSGVPGAGKTTAVNEFFCRLAKSRGFRTIWASFEQRAKPDHRRNLRTFHAERLEKDMTAEEKAAADKWIDAHFRFLVPDDDTEASLDWLLQTLGAAVSRFDPFACVIDPWNALEHTRPAGMTQTEYTGISIERIKRFARRRRVHMLVVAHPTKLQRLQNGEYPRPNLWDIADSAHWANKADLGVMIWRKTGDPETEIAVVKSKYHNELGRPGSIRGIFDETKARLTVTNDGAGMR